MGVGHLVFVDPEGLVNALLVHRPFIVVTAIAAHHEASRRHQHHRHIIELTLHRRPVIIACYACTGGCGRGRGGLGGLGRC